MQNRQGGSAVLCMIKRTFLCKNKELILQLYKSLIRPKLEYCMIQAWRPYFTRSPATAGTANRSLLFLEHRIPMPELFTELRFSVLRNTVAPIRG